MAFTSLPSPLNTSNPYEKIKSGGNNITRLQYPLDMGKYYIAFEFAEYGPSYSTGAIGLVNGGLDLLAAPRAALDAAYNSFIRTTNLATGLNLPTFDTALGRVQGTTYGINGVNAQIALPLPPNLVDDQQLDYNAQNLLNVAGQAVATAASLGARAIGGTDAQQAVNSITNTSADVISKTNDFQSVFTGHTVNPFLAMMFNGPRFKTHQFGWRFSPKNKTETNNLVEIINTFKKYSLPEKASGFFKYPSVVLISIYPATTREKTYKFKPCVITQTSIHYAPTGVPSFFAGSEAPVEVELKLQLSEISIWTKEDF